MSTRSLLDRATWLALALALAVPALLRPMPTLAAPQAAAATFPDFEVEPCCQLCPAAADPLNYQTKYLSSFRQLVQGREGWLFRSKADLLMQFDLTPEGSRRLGELNRALRERGVALVMVVQPPRGLMHKDKLDTSAIGYDPDVARAEYRRVLNELRGQGIVVPQLERLVEQSAGEGSYFWRADHHWTPDGARSTAKIVAERVRQMPEYRGLKHQRFVTTRKGVLARGGTMTKAAMILCGYGSAKQTVANYLTEPAEATNSDDLFGESAVPQITLIGTSQSQATYNFAGFLSEYMEADVLNASVLGGGVDGALLSYLPSEEFRSNRPKIVIWEVATYHDLSDPMLTRQAMPVLGEDCGGQAPVLERTLTLGDGRHEVLFNGGGAVRPIRGSDHFLDLQFSNPEQRELNAVVWYTNGTKDTIRVEHAERAPSHKGRFLVNLRDDPGWGERVFLSLDVEKPVPLAAGAAFSPGAAPATPTSGPLNIHARLCSRSRASSGAAVTAGISADQGEHTR